MVSKHSRWTVIILLCLTLFVTSGHAWLYANEPYRIPITITSPGVLTNYQVLIDLNSSVLTGDTNSNFWINTRSDGKDIRFSNSTDTLPLDYFREFFNDDANTHLWVEIPSLASGDQNIFMYYGSNLSDDNSNFERTFIDDGNGTTMLGWSLAKDAGNDWVSSGGAYLNTSVVGTQHMSRARTFSNALAYAVSIELRSVVGATETDYYLFDEANTLTPFVEDNSNTDLLKLWPSGSDSLATCTIPVSDGVQYDVNVTRDYAGTWRMYANGTSCSVAVDKTDVSGTDHGFSHAGNSDGGADSVYLKNTNAGGEPIYRALRFQDDANTTLRVVDEETGIGLDANLSVNGITVDVNANGYFDINAASSTFPMTISVDVTGYDDRTFYYLTSQGLLENQILGMRVESEANDISFTFYGPDEVTKLPDRIISIIKNGILVGRAQTTSNANVVFNLAPGDSGYSILIKQLGSDTITQYTYSTVSVLVNIPKDEKIQLAISPNDFDMTVGGLGIQSITGAFPRTILILGNTDETYTLSIQDHNGVVYFARAYQASVLGDISSLTINPYLIKLVDGIQVNLKTVDLTTNLTIPNIRIQMRTIISSAITVVEDQLTNAAGIAQVVMLSQRDYLLNITSPNQDTNYFSADQRLSATGTDFSIFIDFTDTNNGLTYKNFDINFAPAGTVLTGATQKVDINMSVGSNFNRLIIQALDQNVVEYQTVCTTSPCNTSFNLTLSNFDKNSVILRGIVEMGDYNFITNRSYFVQAFRTNPEGWVRGLKQYFGVIPLLIFAFLASFGVMIWLGNNPNGDSTANVFIAAIVFGIFVYLWFMDEPLILLGYLGSIFGAGILYIWSRNKQVG